MTFSSYQPFAYPPRCYYVYYVLENILSNQNVQVLQFSVCVLITILKSRLLVVGKNIVHLFLDSFNRNLFTNSYCSDMTVYIYIYIYIYIYRERERETDRQTQRQRQKDRKRGRGKGQTINRWLNSSGNSSPFKYECINTSRLINNTFAMTFSG